MIYLVYVVDEGGNLVWTFQYSVIPKELKERIVEREESAIGGFIAAVRFFGLELTGLEVNVINFGPLNLFVRTYHTAHGTFVVAAFTDSTDHPKLVKNILDSFLELKNTDLANLQTLMIEDAIEYGKKLKELEVTFLELLSRHECRWEIPAKRNIESLFLGIFVGVAVFLITVVMTYYINKFFHLIEQQNYQLLFALIAVLNFFLPALIFGPIAGSVKNAIRGGLMIGLMGVIVVSAWWWEPLERSAMAIFRIEQAILFLGVVIIGVILGGGFGVLASVSAYFTSEMRWLSPPREALVAPTWREGLAEVLRSIRNSFKGLFGIGKASEKKGESK